jgi:hypothetical protein
LDELHAFELGPQRDCIIDEDPPRVRRSQARQAMMGASVTVENDVRFAAVTITLLVR